MSMSGKMPERIYIAGPMTGLPEFNHPAFFERARLLWERGYNPLNPATIKGNLNAPWEWWMKRALAMLVTADGITLLDGWMGSRGARIERRLAAELGIEEVRL